MDILPQTYQSVFPSTLKYYNGAVYYSMWKEGAVCCSFLFPFLGRYVQVKLSMSKTNQPQRGHKIQTCLSENPFRQQVLY